MKIKDLAGKVQTVLGLISPEDLGITLAHEHILIDRLDLFEEPREATERKMAHEAVGIENLWWIRRNLSGCLDNIRLIDEELGIKESMRFKLSGGKTIVELTNNGLCRDPYGLFRISKATGLNIIMGSGFYIGPSQTEEVRKMDTEQLAERIIKDINVGVDKTSICSGIIGEIGATVPVDDFERKSLRAAAIAQQQTGAPINIHPSHSDNLVLENVKILKEGGANLSNTVISHCDAYCFSEDILRKLLDEGCYIEFDTFGYEGYFPPYQGHPFDYPTDTQRVKSLVRLINEGYITQLLVASDHCVKTSLVTFGGFGYDHVLRNVIPLMQMYGITEEQIDTIFIDNPKKMLTFYPVN